MNETSSNHLISIQSDFTLGSFGVLRQREYFSQFNQLREEAKLIEINLSTC